MLLIFIRLVLSNVIIREPYLMAGTDQVLPTQANIIQYNPKKVFIDLTGTKINTPEQDKDQWDTAYITAVQQDYMSFLEKNPIDGRKKNFGLSILN